MDTDDRTQAINRVADALFQQAKAMRVQAKAAERSADVAEQMLAMQMQNLATTRALEETLNDRLHTEYPSN